MATDSRALGVAKDTARHRARRAINLCLIVNLEKRRGKPARPVPADALPAETPCLPSVEDLERYVCLEHSVTGSTVQPVAVAELADESQAPVETTVEEGIQPDFQPVLEPPSDSDCTETEAAVERLNPAQGDHHTYTAGEGDRIYAQALARELNFPVLQIQQGVRVMEGEEIRTRLLERATAGRVSLAITALESFAWPDSSNRGPARS